MKKVTLAKILMVLVAFVVVVSATAGVTYAKGEEDKIYAGVYLDGVYVGGLTKEEAIAEYEKYIAGADRLKMTFTTVSGSYATTLGEVGFSISAEDAVEQAYNYGRQGNILARYKEIRGLEESNAVLVPTKKIDKTKLKEKLETETSEIVNSAQNASISRVDGQFVVQPGVVGTTIKVEDTIKLVDDILTAEWEQKDITIKAVVEETEPQYTEADFEAIDSVLGQGSTEYSQGNAARSQNLSTGASKISGTVLMPGEQFSVYNTVSPFSEENGYQNAGMYVSNENGDIETVDGFGGGICQVSTTLYLAVLRAELKVDERYPHSLTVSYVKHGMDAAIAGDYMDFKFTNDTGYPIYIEGYAGGGTISFAIYGHDTREEGRTIAFESVDVETYEPGEPEETKDDTIEEGTRVTEQSAHTGYYTELYKCVYKDGVLVSRELVPYGRSKYQSQKAKVKVGTKKKEKKDDEEDEDKSKDKGSKGDEPEKSDDTPTTEAPVVEPTTEAPATEAPSEGE